MLKDIAGNILQLVFNIENQNEIINNIWLGNYKASLNKDFIKNKGIEVIFNCTRSHPFIEDDNIIKYRLDVNDHSNDLLRMRKNIDWASYTLNHHMKNNKKILIHCHAGLQRSATLLAYTLMKYRNISLNKLFFHNSICEFNNRQTISNIPLFRILPTITHLSFSRKIHNYFWSKIIN